MYIKIESSTRQEQNHTIEMYSVLSKELLLNMNFKVKGNKVEVI